MANATSGGARKAAWTKNTIKLFIIYLLFYTLHGWDLPSSKFKPIYLIMAKIQFIICSCNIKYPH